MDPRVRGHHGAEVGTAIKRLEDSGREEGLAELDELEDGVGGEGGGFDDDAVAGDEGGGDFEGG